MKDPCIDCIVSPMCSEVCGAKTNYGNLLNNTFEIYHNIFFKDTRNINNKKEYQKWRGIRDKHRKSVVEIETRCRNLGKHNS